MWAWVRVLPLRSGQHRHCDDKNTVSTRHELRLVHILTNPEISPFIREGGGFPDIICLSDFIDLVETDGKADKRKKCFSIPFWANSPMTWLSISGRQRS
jgi:hypothetical protein